MLSPTICVTSISTYDTGAVIATHCDKCRETVFMYSPYATQPKDGDYFLVNGICENVVHCFPTPWHEPPVPLTNAAVSPGSNITREWMSVQDLLSQMR